MLEFVHRYDVDSEILTQAVVNYARERLRLNPVPLDGTHSRAELTTAVGETITPDGIGGVEALRIFDELLSRACISVDHPRNLSFIPAAPTKAAILFDLVVGASSVYAGSWLEGAGAVHAENQALRWLSDLAGFPPEAGGVFVQGGTIGNLSALVAARYRMQTRGGAAPAGGRPTVWRIACGAEAHSSVEAAARVMGAELLVVPADAEGRLTGPALAHALDTADPDVRDSVFAVVATAGTTQFGIVDDIRGIVDVAHERDLWAHVDGAYGLAALAAESVRHLFAGTADADSFIVDPHKWLFAPFDACALIYREPALARAAHAQKAGYLEVLETADDWNPADYAIGLSRRARGLPFWFSLATHGTRAYGAAVEKSLATARAAADQIRALPYVELVREPQLSVVVLRRLNWTPENYYEWTEKLLRAGFAFVTPTVHEGETVTRFAIVNPCTEPADIAAILGSMA
ncbi:MULTISPECIES: pyridoxal phosphate-dependent decarboxylase family protein [Protofrankia]|uniref:Diaminobutyrate decarboxylase n=1 Tax=Candidatus Protofrankia datiscae TaxID=2716812 RepID=F8AZA7_9ACTN|nr:MULTISPECIES: aminotransferase class V-fold PLP-dependent enzyme [Protofrankia]AEH11636.1 Diaminobutyrate decarboxylase [Candidatus Protofrankia datiscae]